ncbi:hypothetical protein VTK73DRAFT_7366 [Phialemonium thermophilum]|uniref:Uncharacterized protein n=1 Tax=Phialemonium thermophilum TaxID=223376 RepID=A0ABR3WFL1_9PEZI
MSIDDYVFRHHGVVDRDFPAERYESYTDEAEEANRQQLVQILHEGARDVVIDYSFYSHAARDEYRELVATEGRGRYRGECCCGDAGLQMLFKAGWLGDSLRTGLQLSWYISTEQSRRCGSGSAPDRRRGQSCWPKGAPSWAIPTVSSQGAC